MVKHYFKVTFRHIRKHLLISILNISGLAIGIACFVLIMLYVNHELNYDKFNEYYNDIYRVAVDAQIGNTVIRQTWTPAPMPAALYDEFPEIAGHHPNRRLATNHSVIGDREYNEPRAAMVDSSFSEIFTLDFVEGSPEQVLNEPGQVLLDRTTAAKYFGDEPAMGGVIMIRDTIALTVTGVYQDLPAQAHFHFNLLISLVSPDGLYNNPSGSPIILKPTCDWSHGFPEDKLEAKLPAFR